MFFKQYTKHIYFVLQYHEFIGVCARMHSIKISMHEASRSENIRSTSKYYHTKFHIFPSSILAVFCLQIHLWGLCTYARLCKSACTMQVDRKTFALLQSNIVPDFTSLRQRCSRFFDSVLLISSTLFANSFWGSVHVCTKTSMHNASKSDNICSILKYSHSKFT